MWTTTLSSLLLVSTTIILNTCSGKSFQREENSLLKALSSLKSPELVNERLFAEAILASESTGNSLTHRQVSRGPRMEPSNSFEHQRSGRQKRTVGFLTRLGACVLTFMSNPTCWQRLTRAQIMQEQNRQRDLLQQEQQRRYLEQKIYQGYINTLLGQGTNGTMTGSNSTDTAPSSITFPLLSMPTMSIPTTSRPKLFPMAHRLMSRLFPRLYSTFMNPESTPSQSSFYTTSGNSLITRNDPQYRNLY